MNPQNQNGQNVDPLMDEEDRPAGSGVNSTPATAVFAAAPGTAKKKIQPENETAIRRELAASQPVKPAIDTSNIYNAGARGPRDMTSQTKTSTTNQRQTVGTTAASPPAAIQADPELAAHMPAAALQQKRTIAIRAIIPQIQTFAIVMIVLSGLTTVLSAIRFFAAWHTYGYGAGSNQLFSATSSPVTTLAIVSLCIGALPIIFGAYMLTGKRPAIIKAFLIITGLSYAYSFVNIGIVFAKTPSVYLAFAGLIAGGFVYWTWQVFSSIEKLEEST